jgi:CrcB protein
MVQAYFLVFLGGGIGAALRHGVNIGAARLLGIGFAYGTLTVNLFGSLLMGLIVSQAKTRAHELPERAGSKEPTI